MLEKTLESPLDNKKIKPVNLKRNQSWIFIGKTDAETPVLWPPEANNRLIGKDSDAGKDWRQEEKGMTEDEIIGIASLTRWAWVWASSKSWWCSPWGHKASDMTERLNWTEVGELWKLSTHIWLGKITVWQPGLGGGGGGGEQSCMTKLLTYEIWWHHRLIVSELTGTIGHTTGVWELLGVQKESTH